MGAGWIDFLTQQWFPAQDKIQRAKEARALHQKCAKCDGKRHRGGKTCGPHKADNCEVFDCPNPTASSRGAGQSLFCETHQQRYYKEGSDFTNGYEWLKSLETESQYSLEAPKPTAKEKVRQAKERAMGHQQHAFHEQMERAAAWDFVCVVDTCGQHSVAGTKFCPSHIDSVSLPGDCAIATCPSDRKSGYIVCEHHHEEHLAHHWHKNFYTALSAMNKAQHEANQKTWQQHACAADLSTCDCGNKIEIGGLKRCEQCALKPQHTCSIARCEQEQIPDDYFCAHHRQRFEEHVARREGLHYSDIIRAIANNPEHTMTATKPTEATALCENCQDALATLSGLSRRCMGCLLSGAVQHAQPTTVLSTQCTVEECSTPRIEKHEFCEAHRKQWVQHLDNEVGLRSSIDAARFGAVIQAFFTALKNERNNAMQQDKNKQPQASAATPTQTSTSDQLLGDAKESARRLAAKQFIKLTRDPMIAFLAGHLDKDDPSMRVKVAAFLDTELGEGLVAVLLSLGVSLLPVEHPEVKTLAQQLRIKAMTDVGDVVADLLMGPLRDFMSTVIKGAPLAALPAGTNNVAVPNFVEVSQVQEVRG
jgi:hypothetical protein